MNILLISQCDKRALSETRRILDQFAERRGDRTWQTPITQAGLDTLHRLLRKSARKNTAVACHWIRGLNHSELLWIVGDRRRFNTQGAVPTNMTRRNILRQADENDWHSAELMRLLADLAGMLHDLGKSIAAFQARLHGKLQGHNLIRHEWVSVRLLAAFVGTDDDATWLARLAEPGAANAACWREHLQRDGLDRDPASPFLSMAQAPLAQALAWLILTHHRLPQWPDPESFSASVLSRLLDHLGPAWNESAFGKATAAELQPYWQFPQGLPVSEPQWHHRAARIARRLLRWHAGHSQEDAAILDNPFVLHLTRLTLMLADHHYSSLEGPHKERVSAPAIDANTLLANTCSGNSAPNQSLPEHLLGVARSSAEIARFLPRFADSLPHLARHRGLTKHATQPPFRWQNKAAELAAGIRRRSQEHGAFIINMASTGCGKTLANARIMHALADPETGMRCAFALGLRTLTLQTGAAFRERLRLGEEELAIQVGGSANRRLFEHHEARAQQSGSASRQALMEEDGYVVYEGAIDQHPLLRRAIRDPQVRKLLLAPLLVCTIDHLMPATESQRGGRQIAPMLRLLSGDLVLDEPDDFALEDLPALTRLVHWAGLLGARVLLSSATLPPALVQGLFAAYRNGRSHFQRNCSPHPGEHPETAPVCCAWVDEFSRQAEDCTDPEHFARLHQQFAQARHQELARHASTPRRIGAILPFAPPDDPRDLPTLAETFAPQALEAAIRLHQAHHSQDTHSHKRVSFGLIRMANIEPLYEVALALFRQTPPAGTRVHLCVYHASHPLLVRSAIEQQLDQALRRHVPEAVFDQPEIRRQLDPFPETDHLFIVLGSPVTEVGRDHDYDWAIVEPSSMRSLIQLAGRVRRHRMTPVDTPNILVFSHNLRHFRFPGKAAFCRPGFEEDPGRDEGAFYLCSHDLRALVNEEEIRRIDARPRILAPEPSLQQPRQRLSDLEHARLQHMMLPRQNTRPTSRRERARHTRTVTLNAASWWQMPPRDALTSAILPQRQPFRRESVPADVTLVLLPDEDNDQAVLHRITEKKGHQPDLHEEIDRSLCEHLPDAVVQGTRITPWGVTDYLEALEKLAAELDLSLPSCAWKFGQTQVRDHSEHGGWRYHPVLGFAKKRG